MDRALAKNTKCTHSFLILQLAVLVRVEHFHQLFGNIIDFNVFVMGQFVSSLFKSLFTNYFLERLFKLIDRNVVRSLVLLEFYHYDEKANWRKQRVLLQFYNNVNEFRFMQKPFNEVFRILELSTCKVWFFGWFLLTLYCRNIFFIKVNLLASHPLHKLSEIDLTFAFDNFVVLETLLSCHVSHFFHFYLVPYFRIVLPDWIKYLKDTIDKFVELIKT